MLPSIKKTFEDSLKDIDIEINKRRKKWNLTILAWLDYEDVSQIIRIHIYKKWHLYDPSKPLAPWVNRIISNQIKNLIRNLYGNYSRPCLKCAAAEGEDNCRIYHKQCVDCPLFKAWFKSKKHAHDTKLPVSLENHVQELYALPNDSADLERAAETLHVHMQKVLKPMEWRLYKYIYIEEKSEDEAAKLMGYKTTEKNRKAGYGQIRNLKISIIGKAKEYVYSGDIDL